MLRRELVAISLGLVTRGPEATINASVCRAGASKVELRGSRRSPAPDGE